MAPLVAMSIPDQVDGASPSSGTSSLLLLLSDRLWFSGRELSSSYLKPSPGPQSAAHSSSSKKLTAALGKTAHVALMDLIKLYLQMFS